MEAFDDCFNIIIFIKVHVWRQWMLQDFVNAIKEGCNVSCTGCSWKIDVQTELCGISIMWMICSWIMERPHSVCVPCGPHAVRHLFKVSPSPLSSTTLDVVLMCCSSTPQWCKRVSTEVVQTMCGNALSVPD